MYRRKHRKAVLCGIDEERVATRIVLTYDYPTRFPVSIRFAGQWSAPRVRGIAYLQNAAYIIGLTISNCAPWSFAVLGWSRRGRRRPQGQVVVQFEEHRLPREGSYVDGGARSARRGFSLGSYRVRGI